MPYDGRKACLHLFQTRHNGVAVGTLDGIEQLQNSGAVGRQRFMVADEVSGAFERPIDPECFRLVGDAFNQPLEPSRHQVGFVEGEKVGNLDGSQRNSKRRLHGRIRQE